jgi:ATP-binding cassette, subfamily B, bacterial
MKPSRKYGPSDFSHAISKNRLLGLWRMIRGSRLRYLSAALLLGISAAAQTAMYLLVRFFVDRVLPGTTAFPVWGVALCFLGLASLQGCCTFLSGRLSSGVAEGITRRLRDALYDRIQKLPFSYHDKTPTGDLIERVTSDVDAVRKFFSDQAIGFGRIVFLFAINFTILLSLNVTLAFVSVAVIPVVLLVSILFFKAISKRYEKYQEQEAVLSTTLQENLTGVRVVKAFARQAFEKDRFESVNREKFLRGRRLMLMHSLFWPITDVLCGVQTFGGYLAAAVLAIRGSLSVGTYIAYCGIILQLIWPIRFLGRLIVDISSGLVSYERVMAVLKEAQEPLSEGTRGGDRLAGRIEYEGVGFGCDPARPILSDISFRCEPGQAVALLGSTGSGKTSLVNLIPRFYDYTAGSIRLDGRELREYAPGWLRGRIGIVEQEPFLFSRTIRENITYGVQREVSDAEIEEAARAAAIHDVILQFPQGYATRVGERGVTLSGGQKQRVAIARTLLKDPSILILDDSTSSVDTETEEAIRTALERLMRGRTTFLIAHRIQSLMKADLILVFDGGRIVERGTHAALLAAGGIYRRIFDMQTRIDAEVERETADV